MVKNKFVQWICSATLLAAAVSARAQSQIPDTAMTGLSSLLRQIDSHPMIAYEAANVEAARRRIAEKSSLDNPMLTLGVNNLPTTSFGFSEDPMTTKMIGASQAFPWPGKLKAEAEIAAQDTLTASDDLEEERNTLTRDVKSAYFDLYHIERIIAVYNFHQKAADELVQLAESKLPEGKATQSQVLNLKLERTDIDDQVIDYETMLRERQADLEGATGVSGDIPIPERLGFPIFSYSLGALDSLARANNPRLQKLRTESEQEQLRYDRADLEKYPDFQVSLDYMQRDALAASAPMNWTGIPMQQSNMISLGVNIELPLNYNDKIGAARGEAAAMETAERAEERAVELELHTKLETDLAKLRGIRGKYTLLRDEIYPTARQALQTTTADYTFDKSTLEEAVRAQLELIHREHDRYELEAEYNKTIADMEYLTGISLVIYTSKSDWK